MKEEYSVTQLYPATGQQLPVKGLYLRESMMENADLNRPRIIANFLSSLDGRIALRSPGDEHYDLPAQLKSATDFNLFLELHACADCIVTHSGYLRALKEGRHGNVLQLPSQSEFDYLRSWRQTHGLGSAPDVVVMSSSLDFPLEPEWLAPTQKVHIVTGKKHLVDKKEYWQEQGYEVTVLPCSTIIDAPTLNRCLIEQAYRTVYLVAGPLLLESMLAHSLLDHFFLTIRHHILGGSDYHTLIPNHFLGDKGGLQLQKLYLDQSAGMEHAQWYSEFTQLADNQNLSR